MSRNDELVAVVTGGSRGIGKGVARDCRSQAGGEQVGAFSAIADDWPANRKLSTDHAVNSRLVSYS